MTERNLADIEQWVRNGHDLAAGDFRAADLSHNVLSGGKFTGADFTGVDLSYASLRGTDFTDAKLTGANLYCCDLNTTIVAGADLTGTYLSDAGIEETDFTGCKGIVDAGTDPRGYRFIGVAGEDGAWMVKAGCRWFTLDEARAHWGHKSNDDAMDRVERIVALAG